MFKKVNKTLARFLVFVLVISLFIMAPDSMMVNRVSSAPIIEMDYQSFVSSGDVYHTGNITTSKIGITIGIWSVGSYLKLLSNGKFLVSSPAKNREICFTEINSQLGGACRIRNPWPGSTISVYRNGVKAEDLTRSIISFSTDNSEDIKIVRQGVNPDSFNENISVSK